MGKKPKTSKTIYMAHIFKFAFLAAVLRFTRFSVNSKGSVSTLLKASQFCQRKTIPPTILRKAIWRHYSSNTNQKIQLSKIKLFLWILSAFWDRHPYGISKTLIKIYSEWLESCCYCYFSPQWRRWYLQECPFTSWIHASCTMHWLRRMYASYWFISVAFRNTQDIWQRCLAPCWSLLKSKQFIWHGSQPLDKCVLSCISQDTIGV